MQMKFLLTKSTINQFAFVVQMVARIKVIRGLQFLVRLSFSAAKPPAVMEGTVR
jgi:hypothetical protein